MTTLVKHETECCAGRLHYQIFSAPGHKLHLRSFRAPKTRLALRVLDFTNRLLAQTPAFHVLPKGGTVRSAILNNAEAFISRRPNHGSVIRLFRDWLTFD